MSQSQFPFFDLTRQHQTIKNEVMEVVARVFEKQAFVMGDEVTQLENELARYMGVKHVVTCANGTDALVLALKAMGIGEGDEVLTTPFSFFASTSSILLAGAKPVFVDIDPATFNIDPGALTKALTEKTKAIMPVHLFGQCAEMDAIMSFAKRYNLLVLEDAAQSIGARYGDRGACSMGTMGSVSFYPTKNLGGAGEGGAVATNDDKLAERAKLIRVHGMKVRYTHDLLGWNSRLDALQAAVLRVKLRHLDQWVSRRNQLARQYAELLAPLAKTERLVLPRTAAGRSHVWNQYTVLVKDRDGVRKKLEEKGIPTDIFYPKTIPAQPVMQELGYKEQNIPVSVECAKRALALPIFPELTDGEQRKVAEALIQILG
jgi:dTDP-4-amino-4,6-dideoxygalactose transaminase